MKKAIDYIVDPAKTDDKLLVSSFGCAVETADLEFEKTRLLAMQKGNNLAHHLIQAFEPGEVSYAQAHEIGRQLADEILGGKYEYVIATHINKEHCHNHIIFCAVDFAEHKKYVSNRKSYAQIRRVSDRLCRENGLSVVAPGAERGKQYAEWDAQRKGTSYKQKLKIAIDRLILISKDLDDLLRRLEAEGYEIKRGKHTSVKGARQKRFIRFRTLGAGYSEDEIKAVLEGKAKHQPYQKQPPKEQPFHLLVDIQAKLSEGKGEGYARWAKHYNLKEMSKTLIFLQENKIGSIEEMQERVNAATARYHELGDSIKAAEQRMAEIAVLRAHIVNYARTRPVYDAYRKAGYSKKFLEEHREQITLHKAAKAAFDEANLKKLPKVKELDAEYAALLSQKKAAYPAYRKARDKMQELKKAQKNVELFFTEEKDTKEKLQTR